jgi:hypothetical protein
MIFYKTSSLLSLSMLIWLPSLESQFIYLEKKSGTFNVNDQPHSFILLKTETVGLSISYDEKNPNW